MLQASAEWLGLHSSVVRAIPTFAVYLGTLMHVYHLGRHEVGTAAFEAMHDMDMWKMSMHFKVTWQWLVLEGAPSMCRCHP